VQHTTGVFSASCVFQYAKSLVLLHAPSSEIIKLIVSTWKSQSCFHCAGQVSLSHIKGPTRQGEIGGTSHPGKRKTVSGLILRFIG